MRILVLEGYASSDAGGAERTMRRFLEAIEDEHELHIAYAKPGDLVCEPKKAALYSSTLDLDLKPLNLQNLPKTVRDLYLLNKFVRSHRIDRIITHMVHVSPLLRILKTISAVPFSIYFKWVCSTVTAGAKVNWGNAAADRVAAVSGFVLDYWVRNGAPGDRATVVPEGIQIPIANQSQGPGSPTLGFAGRLVPEKGLIDLLNAMPAVLAKCPDVILRVAGAYRQGEEGETYRKEVETCIAALGISDSVFFDGFVSPLEDWLDRLSMVVVPSTCDDAQPMVMMQAMASGKAVVATRVGGIPEVLTGELGELVVPPGDPVELGSRIVQQLQDHDRRERVGVALRKRCSEHYSYPVHITALSEALGISKSSGALQSKTLGVQKA